jgi:hypothetical protein
MSAITTPFFHLCIFKTSNFRVAVLVLTRLDQTLSFRFAMGDVQ